MRDREPTTDALALAALLGGADPPADVRPDADPGRWRLLAALAGRHRLAPLLYARITGLPPSALPQPPLLAHLRRAYLHTLQVNERARARLVEIADALAAHGVHPVLLKGAHLAFDVHADPATRPMSDVDLLVRPDQVPQAAAALAELGCLPLTPYSLEAELARAAHLPAFVAPGELPVELHWRLLRPGLPYRIEAATLIGRSRTSATLGRGARVLDPADAFLHLALHAIVKDGLRHGLRALTDLALLISRTSHDAAWSEAAARARDAGAGRVHDLALALLGKLLPEWLPHPLPLTAAGAPPDRPVLDLACHLALEAPAHDAGVTPNVAGVFGSGAAAGVRHILQRALPARAEMSALDPAPPGFAAGLLRYPRRWAMLVTRHGPAIWELARRRPDARAAAERLALHRTLADWCAGR